MQKIKKGDLVQIIAGKDKGKKAKVLQVLPSPNQVVIEGLNLRTKIVRPKRAGEKGQIVKFPAPFDLSNVMYFCSKCSRPVRVGIQQNPDGKKVRICKRCKTTL